MLTALKLQTCSWSALVAGMALLALSTSADAQKRSYLELKEEAVARAAQRKLDAKAVKTKASSDACRCASPRLVAVGGPIVLDESGPLSVWIDDSGARVDVFDANDLERGFRPVATPSDVLPLSDGGIAAVDVATAEVTLSANERAIGESLQLTPFPTESFGVVEPSRSQLYRVWMNADVESQLLVGLLRKQDRVARDVVRIRAVSPQTSAPAAGPSPELVAAFLGPLETWNSPACGDIVTHRLIANVAEGAPKVAAWLVKRTDAAGDNRVTLVDARHVAMFGVGRVDGCGQGLSLSPDEKMTLELRPVSSTFGVGDPWVFETPGPIAAEARVAADDDTKADAKPPMPTLLTAPPSRQEGVSNPFVDGFGTRKLSGAKDRVAFGSMAFVVGGAIVVAAFLYSIRRRRRRRIEVHGCPSCGEEMSLDVADPDTDGFFCPACGNSSVTVLQTPDGPRVRVYPVGDAARGEG